MAIGFSRLIARVARERAKAPKAAAMVVTLFSAAADCDDVVDATTRRRDVDYVSSTSTENNVNPGAVVITVKESSIVIRLGPIIHPARKRTRTHDNTTVR
jgi:hypothetical protein